MNKRSPSPKPPQQKQKQKRRAAAVDASAGLVLAMDIGTSSLRSALFTLDGQRLEATTAQHKYPLHTAPNGTAELSPADLVKAADRALTETLKFQRADAALRDAPILAWGTGCFWHSMLGADDQFEALTPIYTWADSRCAPDAARLRAALPEEAVHARTGCMLRTSFWPAKLAWLARSQKGLLRRVKHWLSPADYLHARFCGRLQPSLSMASGSGLLNAQTGQWDEELTRCLGFTPTHEPPTGGDHPLRLNEAFVRRFPALRGMPIFPAIGDGAASNLGSGATARGVAAINYGTSAAMRVVRPGKYQPAPFGLFCYAIDPDRWLVGGAISNAGNAYQWSSQVFQGADDEKAFEAALKRRPEPDPSLVALAFLNGERAPSWCEDLPGVIFGLRQSHTALDVHRALTEASFLRLAQIVEPLEKAAGVRQLRFVVSGGLSRSQSAVQRMVNALGRPCALSDEPEASLRGAAVYALEKLGRKVAAPTCSHSLKPQPALAKLYRAARDRQTALEAVLRQFVAN